MSSLKKVPPNVISLTQYDHLPSAPRLRLQVMKNSKGYVELNLNDRDLRIIPPETFHMVSAQVLRLVNNHIDHLPLMIAYLRDLKVLDMQHNLLVSLPETLANCRLLAELKLTANRLTDVPSSLGSLTSLRVLELGENQLEHLPQEIGLLSSLKVLDLHGNKLWQLPVSLQGCKQVVKLDLSDNMFDHIPLVVTKLVTLKALSLAKNRLAALPVDFDCLKQLRELNLSHNKFVSISSMLLALKHLRYLTLASNGLKFLPPHLSTLQNLRVLHLQDNELRHVPTNFKHLSYYNVSKNHLTTLSVDGLKNLVSLAVSNNELESPPRGLYKLKHLKFLYMNDNLLVELDDDVGKLRQLRVLDLSNNQLVLLPHTLYRLPRLHTFNVKGNHKLTNTVSIDPTQVKGKHPKETSDHKNNNVEKKGENSDQVKKTASDDKMELGKETLPRDAISTNGNLSVLDKMNGYGPDMLQAMSKNEIKKSHKASGKPSKFQSVRSLREILFGTSRIVRSEDPAAAMRSSNSINFPIQYSRQEVELAGRVGTHQGRNKWSSSRTPFPGRSRRRTKLDEELFWDKGRAPAVYPEKVLSGGSREYYPIRHRHAVNRTYSHRDVGYISGKPLEFYYDDSDNSSYESEEERHYGPGDSFQMPRTRPRSFPVHSQMFGEPQASGHYRDHGLNARTSQLSRHDYDRRSHYNDTDSVDYRMRPAYKYRKNGGDSEARVNYFISNSNIAYDNPNIRASNYVAFDDVSFSSTDSEGESYTEEAVRFSVHHHGGNSDKYAEYSPPIRVTGRFFSVEQDGQTFDHILSTQETSRDPDSPAMYYDENFSMKKKKSQGLKRTRSLDSLLQKTSGENLQKEDEKDGSSSSHVPYKTIQKGADYSLLGVCTQLEDMLNKNIAHSNLEGGQRKVSSRSLQRTNFVSQQKRKDVSYYRQVEVEDPDMEYQQPQTFTVSSTGGQFVSSSYPAVTVTVPVHAVRHNLQITIQLLLVSQHLLEKVKQLNRFVNNIISMGPIIYLHADQPVTFDSQATLTIPAPAPARGGHLVVLTIRRDNSCIPCSSAHRSERLSATVNVWQLSGKVALVTKAKCKYKACKSMEQLLLCLGVTG